jgi:Single-stranded DNA-binding replication protein A (RPA), large (70 kD) subunit and related ssDNA-binding proteins
LPPTKKNTGGREIMSEIQSQAAEITEQLSDHVEGVSQDEVESRLENLVSDYGVPMDEASRSVKNSYIDQEEDVDLSDMGGGSNESILVGEIDQDEQWVDATVKVVDLWEARSDSVSQVGLVGDESGRTKFIAFETSDLPKLEEGTTYHLENLVTDEYEGDYSLKLNRTTEITELDDDIDVGTNAVRGALVDVQGGSGLIKRCSEEGCTRVLSSGRCSEHGDVDHEFDLRIKAVIDTGTGIQEVIFDRETTEELTDFDLDKARELAKEEYDTGAVADVMIPNIIGEYYEVVGPITGRYLLVDEFSRVRETADSDTEGMTDPESLLTRARSI